MSWMSHGLGPQVVIDGHHRLELFKAAGMTIVLAAQHQLGSKAQVLVRARLMHLSKSLQFMQATASFPLHRYAIPIATAHYLSI